VNDLLKGSSLWGKDWTYVPQHDSLRRIGSIPPVVGIPPTPDQIKPRTSATISLLYDLEGVVLKEQMGVSRPNMWSCCFHASKYDRPRHVNLHQEANEITERMWRGILCPWIQGWKEMETPEILAEFVTSSSAGFPYKELGFETRGDVIADGHKGLPSVFDYLRVLEDPLSDWSQRVWNSFTKTELLKAKKFSGGEYRGIMSPPTDLYYAQVKWHGDLSKRIKRANREMFLYSTGMALQFTPFYGGIDALQRYMEEVDHGPFGPWVKSESDLKEYDSSQEEEFSLMERDLAKDTYGGENPNYEVILDRLWLEEVKTFFLCENGQVLQKSAGQDSGSYITSRSNSFKRLRYLLYAWVRLVWLPWRDGLLADVIRGDNERTLAQQEEIAKLEVMVGKGDELGLFRATVRPAVLGDDELLSYHPLYYKVFSVQQRSQLLEQECGLYTEVETVDSFSLEGHVFLGWRWRKKGGLMVPTFSEERVLQSLKTPTGSVKDEDLPQRILGLLPLVYHNERGQGSAYYVLKKAWSALQDARPEVLSGFIFPTEQDLKGIWTGQESMATPKGQQLCALARKTLCDLGCYDAQLN